jgi:predicted dehydrogenase
VSCQAISSFGSLKHFRRSEKPIEAGNAVRCLDCAFEPRCPYSARKIYLGRLANGETGWPVDVVDPSPTETRLTEALANGQYGRCVYECDNDVVDNQVVNMLFAGGQTANFTMTAFTQARPRQTRIFGTRGELTLDGVRIQHYDFLTDETTILEAPHSGAPMPGHDGGDYALMDSFVSAVAEDNPARILSGPRESLESHLMVFAAEQSRREQVVVPL